MEVTLIVNGLDLGKKLSTYDVGQEVAYRKVVVTLDEVEHPYPVTPRPVITFSLLPLTDEESAKFFNAIRGMIFDCTFTNQYTGMDETKRVRVTSNLESQFLLLSVDGKRRYRGGKIQLRVL